LPAFFVKSEAIKPEPSDAGDAGVVANMPKVELGSSGCPQVLPSRGRERERERERESSNLFAVNGLSVPSFVDFSVWGGEVYSNSCSDRHAESNTNAAKCSRLGRRDCSSSSRSLPLAKIDGNHADGTPA
jgi:hypothetical protein